jgi:hypothetical protein
MKFLVAALVVLVGCSTKPNPNRCCTDTADCSAAGIPDVTPCSDDLVCRGHQCIAETCTSSDQCDLSAPFCVDGACGAMCTADDECPGNGGDPTDVHCVGGACVACRADGNDCPANAPVCDAGTCRGCTADSECSSGACDVDAGSCLDETTVLYAAPSGSASSDCSKATPCTLARALSIADSSRPSIKLAAGSYSDEMYFSGAFTLTVYGPATINSDVEVQGNANGLRLRDIDIAFYVDCEASASNLPHPQVDLRRVKINVNFNAAPVGLGGTLCDISATDVAITADRGDNVGVVVALTGVAGVGGANATFDRVTIDGGDPVFSIGDASTLSVVNSMFTNQGISHGLAILQSVSGAAESGTIQFSTFYNSTVTCPASGTAFLNFANNVFLNTRSGAATNTVSGTGCTHRYDMIKPQSTSPGSTNLLNMDPRFVDAAHGDFHLMAGSPAIDAADSAATLSTDFDGTTRPQGAGRDLGAFEYKP